MFDPGSQQPATYTSYVQLTDPKYKIDAEDRIIWMNHPLNHRDFKLYQSGYEFVTRDGREKPVSYSNFTVSRDPGIWFKYVGSTMLAVGIFCMFYMKAYFFQARGRKTASSVADAEPLA
jgi:cytochrome c biogenesis protein ResB